MLLPLACLKRYFLKFYKYWVSVCDIIRFKRSASCGKVKCSISVHILRSPWAGWLNLTSHWGEKHQISALFEHYCFWETYKRTTGNKPWGKSFLDMLIKIRFAMWQIRKNKFWDHYVMFLNNCPFKSLDLRSEFETLIRFQLLTKFLNSRITTK